MQNETSWKIMLVDDEELLLDSLEIILSLHKMQITGKAHDGREALLLMKEHPCELALVDLNMKGMGGIELISHLKKDYPQTKILVLTTFYDDENITRAIAGGADGYLLKDSGKEAVIGAINQIMGGRNVIEAKVMNRLAALMLQRGGGNSRDGENIGATGRGVDGQLRESRLIMELTEREKEICSLLSEGLNNKQIAETLYISEGTVKNYISGIYDKTGIHDRAKLIVELGRDL